MARSTARALLRVSSASDCGTESSTIPAPADGGNAVLNVGGADHDAGIEVTVSGEIAHGTTVAAATASFRFGDQLHSADFRRAAQRAHVHAGAVGVQDVEVVAQLTHHAGDRCMTKE